MRARALGVTLNDGITRLNLDPAAPGVGKVHPCKVRTALPGLWVAPFPRAVALAPDEGVPTVEGGVRDPALVDVSRDVGEGRDGGAVHDVLHEHFRFGARLLGVDLALPLLEQLAVRNVGRLCFGVEVGLGRTGGTHRCGGQGPPHFWLLPGDRQLVDGEGHDELFGPAVRDG